MKKSALISIYRSLDKKEQRELGKWIKSPVHNQRPDVQDLHEYLLKSDHLYKESALDKERVWRKLFPKERFEDAKMRQTLHFSLKTVEAWLSYRQWQQDEVMGKLALAKELRRRNLDKELIRTLKNVSKLQTAADHQNEDYFRNEYLLQQEHYTYRAARQRTNRDLNLQLVAHALDQAYLIEKLKLCCRMLFHQRLSKTPYDTGLLEPVMAFIQPEDLDSFHALAIYYYVIKAITNPDESIYFERLRNTLREHGNILPLPDLKEVFLMAINLCIPKVNAGDLEYTRQSFELYRLGLEQEILTENKQLSRYTYLNAFLNALKLQEYDWAENFLEEKREMLNEPVRESTYLFARSRLLYDRQEYEATMRMLVQMDFKDPMYNLLSKYMLLKIYYELGEYDTLESLLDSLGAYLRRKDIVESQKINGKNIIRMARALLRLEPFNKEKRQELRKEMEATQPLTEKKWFLEQIDAL